MRARTVYRSALAMALSGAFLLVWLSLGVGIIGRDGDPANLMYFGVLAVGVAGASWPAFAPAGWRARWPQPHVPRRSP